MAGIKEDIISRVQYAFWIIVLVGILILGKAFYIKTFERGRWQEAAKRNAVRYRPIKAARGNIYSDNGSLLATSLPFYDVGFDPTRPDRKTFIDGIDSLAWLLSRKFPQLSESEYRNLILESRASKKRYIPISDKHIDYQLRKELLTWPIWRLGRMKGGVVFDRNETRYFPFETLARRTIGTVNNENRGISGIEFSFNAELAGHDGEAIFRRTAGGAWIPLNDGTYIRPVNGLDVHTFIDVNLQDVATTSLQAALYQNGAKAGCVVLMEVETGHIKAIANLGRSSPDQPYREDFNYAVASAFEPGSTLKLASYLALLEEGDFNIFDTVLTGDGTYAFAKDAIMHDSRKGGWGKINYLQAFAVSSNVAIAKAIRDKFADRPDKFIKYLIDFGLTQPIDFQLQGASKPYFRTPTDPDWSSISLPWLSIGYESAMSPLHMLTFYNAIANNGTMVQPLLIKEIKNGTEIKRVFKDKVLKKKICSDRSLNIARQLLEEVVKNGTARNVYNQDYLIAGKTGTSKKNVGGKYVDNKYYATFVGYFPADRPKYSCIVAIDEPQGAQRYGSDVAAPVFKDLADKIYANNLNLHQPADLTIAGNNTPPRVYGGHIGELNYLCNLLGISSHGEIDETHPYVRATNTANAVNWSKLSRQNGLMPNVTGFTLRDALPLLENMGLKVQVVGAGTVAYQWPRSNTSIYKGQPVKLELK